MKKKTGNMEKTLKRVQGDISSLCKTGNKPTCVAPQNDSQRECITGNKPACVALWNDSRCHPEFILESIQLQDK